MENFGNLAGSSRSYGSSKEQDVISLDSQNIDKVHKESIGIVQNGFRRAVFIFKKAVAWKLHCKNIALQVLLNHLKQVLGHPDILSISVKINEELGTLWELEEETGDERGGLELLALTQKTLLRLHTFIDILAVIGLLLLHVLQLRIGESRNVDDLVFVRQIGVGRFGCRKYEEVEVH